MGNKSSNMSSSQQSNKRYKYEEAKRNKRLEANRKSAAASRQRRLHLIDDLKDTIERMSQKIEGLQKENTELRMKLAMPIANYGVTGFQSTGTIFAPQAISMNQESIPSGNKQPTVQISTMGAPDSLQMQPAAIQMPQSGLANGGACMQSAPRLSPTNPMDMSHGMTHGAMHSTYPFQMLPFHPNHQSQMYFVGSASSAHSSSSMPNQSFNKSFGESNYGNDGSVLK